MALGHRTNGRSSTPELALDAKVAFLKCPDSYPHRPIAIRAIETHMSWIFLAGDLVFKLKKPVRCSYLDFSTLSTRRRNCSEEIRLNRRLAPGVYLGKVPLTLSPEKILTLGGSGSAVDWLVKMRRLPEDRMLPRLLQEQALEPGDLRRLVAVLVKFFARTKRVAWSPVVYSQRLRQGLENSCNILLMPRYGLPAERIHRMLISLRAFLVMASRTRLLDERVKAGRIVDGHGDLRPEHICLERVPVIIDCLEFNRDLRLLDTAAEMAFLALECERLGCEETGQALFDLYSRLSGDFPPVELVCFYKSCHACLRAKLAIRHLNEDGVSNWARWRGLALEYLALAEKHALGLSPPARL